MCSLSSSITISARWRNSIGTGGPGVVVYSLGPRTSLHLQKKKRKESAEEDLVQLIQNNNLQSAEFQRVESDWLIGN